MKSPSKKIEEKDEIVKRSSSYIGVTGQSAETAALLDEISELRNQLISSCVKKLSIRPSDSILNHTFF